MNDQTTDLVVATPTPFAPPDALYPQAQLISAIVKPKLTAFNKHTFMSCIFNPDHTDEKKALYDSSDTIFEATPPPTIPKSEAIITTKGIINAPAKTLGTNKYLIGLTFKTRSASICSVTLMVAISDAMEDPIIEMIAKPDIMTPTSLTISIATSIPT